jgi:hypothetical protein
MTIIKSNKKGRAVRQFFFILFGLPTMRGGVDMMLDDNEQ